MANKMSALEKAISDINKKFNCITDAGSLTLERIPLSSPKLNYLSGGGVMRGRIHTFHGAESGGKTVLATYIAGQVQKQKDIPNVVVLIDVERTFDPQYAQTVGLDISSSKFIYVRPPSGEDGFTILDNLISTGEIGCVIWDSVAATPSKKTFDKRVGEANFGATASLMAEGLKFINPKINDYGVVALFLNQVRAKIGGFMGFGPQDNTSVGGRSLPFYSSWTCKVSKADVITSDKEAIGMTMKIKNVKSKICTPFRSATLNLYYNTGFDVESEFLDFFISLGLVEMKGAWITSDKYGIKVQGKVEFSKWLLEHPEEKASMEAEVNKIFASKSIIEDIGNEDDEFLNQVDEYYDLNTTTEEIERD